MQEFQQTEELREYLKDVRLKQQKIALVPTMGNLHEGHLGLVRIAQSHADIVVTSIFVNPSQFMPNEDLDTYPRTLASDREKLKQAGAHALFTPSVETMYPQGLPMKVRVNTPELANILCGASRPGHFDGVATVVALLFNLIQPNIAIFGRKDFQQLRIIEAMCQGLGFPIEVIGAPVAREDDQLAMSSRNQYLSSEERTQAAYLHRTLKDAMQDIIKPSFEFTERRLQSLCDHAELFLTDQGFIPEYFCLRRSQDLQPAIPQGKHSELVLLAAARLGNTRLIDNIEFSIKQPRAN